MLGWLRFFFDNVSDALVHSAKISQTLLTGEREPVQGYLINFALKEAGITHDGEVVANLMGVEVNLSSVAYCPAEIKILEVIKPGDGQELPEEVTSPVGLPKLLSPGLYNIYGVRIIPNGKTTVVAKDTTIIKIR